VNPVPEIDLSELPDVMNKLEVALPSVLQEGASLPLGLSLGLEGMVSDISRRAGYAVQYDGPGGSADDVFDAMSHAEIYGKVSEFTPDMLENMAGNWRTIGGNASRDAGAFASEIGNVVGQDWQGAAAEAAGAGVQRYAVSAVELMIASHTFSSTIAAAQGALSDTKSSVPPPQSISKTDRVLDVFASVSNLVVPGSMKNSQFERDEAEEQARTIMKTLYQPAIRDASDRIPVLPQALDPLSGGSGDAGGAHYVPYGGTSGSAWSGGSGGGGGGASSSGGSLPDAPSNTAGQAGSTTTDTPSSPSTPQETATQAANWTPADSRAGAGPTTSAAGNGTGGGTTSGGGSMLGAPVGGRGGAGGSGTSRSSGRLGGGSGIGGTRGSGGSGAAPRGGSSLGGSSLGGSPLGAPGGTGGSAGGIAGATTAQGRPGAPGMGGMAPGAGRGGSGSDDVHKTPGYLVDAVNGDELIGTLPLVAPPVLGE
jgi:hypothetical protein